MNWSSLKNLMISGEERFIIIENDAPQFVVLSLAEYQRLVQESNQRMQGVNDQLQGMTEDTGEQDAISSLATQTASAKMNTNSFPASIGLEDLPL